MKLHGLSAVNYASMSNHYLDTTYADAFNAGDSPAYTAAGVTIIDRLATPTAALLASLGIHQFPLWDAIQASGKTTAGFIPVEVAQQAVINSAGNVVSGIKEWVPNIAVLLIGAAALGLLLRFRGK